MSNEILTPCGPDENSRGPTEISSGASAKAIRFLWIYVSVVGSILLRISMFDFESGDYRAFLSKWYDHLETRGPWSGLKDNFSDYPPLYLYMLAIATLVPIAKLYAIKLISITFDYVAAWFVYKIVGKRHPQGPTRWVAAGLMLFLPTAVFNSALWGQCDVIYTSAILGTLYWILTKRHIAALCAFGIAAALKPQSIFLTPFLAALFINGTLKWRWCWVPVAVYAACGLPAILAGKPIFRVFFHYAYQKIRPGLTAGTTNWYQWISKGEVSGGNLEVFYTAGVVMTIIVAMFLILAMQNRRALQYDGLLVSYALASVLLVPYFLPGMHERYFFPADVLAIIYAFYVPRGWIVAVLIQFCSFFTYLPYLFRQEPIPRTILALVMTIAIGIVVGRIVKEILDPKQREPYKA